MVANKVPGYLLDVTEDSGEVQNYKYHGREIAAMLQNEGASLAWLESLHRIDLGEDLPMPLNSSCIGFECGERYLRESGILARIRWLIENYTDDAWRLPRYREIKAEVQRDLSNNERGAVEPDRQLGERRREQVSSFAKIRGADQTEARQPAHNTMKAEADRLRAESTRELSKRELAAKVKMSLKLSDSVETIRKRI